MLTGFINENLLICTKYRIYLKKIWNFLHPNKNRYVNEIYQFENKKNILCESSKSLVGFEAIKKMLLLLFIFNKFHLIQINHFSRYSRHLQVLLLQTKFVLKWKFCFKFTWIFHRHKGARRCSHRSPCNYFELIWF